MLEAVLRNIAVATSRCPWAAGYAAGRTTLTQQVKRAPEEVSDQIRIPMRAGAQCLQPRQIVRLVSIDDRVLTCKGRIAHDRVKPTVLTLEDLGKLHVPVKGRDAVLALAQFVRRRLELNRSCFMAPPPSCIQKWKIPVRNGPVLGGKVKGLRSMHRHRQLTDPQQGNRPATRLFQHPAKPLTKYRMLRWDRRTWCP